MNFRDRHYKLQIFNIRERKGEREAEMSVLSMAEMSCARVSALEQGALEQRQRLSLGQDDTQQ